MIILILRKIFSILPFQNGHNVMKLKPSGECNGLKVRFSKIFSTQKESKRPFTFLLS